MIQPSTLKFLTALKKNNNKTWFDEHRNVYESTRADFMVFTEQLIKSIAAFDASIGHLTAKECLFRINRDVRFSKDKSPYKTNMACYFNHAGKNGRGAGYYFHLQPGTSMAAGGIWMPEPAVLAGIRQEIDYNFGDWKKVINNAGFKRTFGSSISNNESLVRPPKGYDENNPAIEFLKMKSFVVRKSFTDKEVQDKAFIKEIAKTFKTIKPLIDFLNLTVE